MKSQKVDVLVVGGGIIGLCVARELQAAGRQVLVIEKGGLGAGCSYANAGWITPCFAMPLPQPGMFWKSLGWLLDSESPLYIKPQLSFTLIQWLYHFARSMNKKQMHKSIAALTEISQYSLQFYEQLAQTAKPGFDFEKRGLLMVSATREGLRHAEIEMDLMHERNITGTKMSQEEVLAFEPTLKPLVKGGVYFSNEAQVEPYQAVLALAEEFKRLGGQIVLQGEVFDFRFKGQHIEEVITTQGSFQADLVVLATGSWSSELAKRLGIHIPILGGKGYSMIIEEAQNPPSRPIMIIERKIAVTPRKNSVRLAGTLELVNQDFGISPNRVQAIYKGAGEYLHLKNESGPRQIWRGLRPCTPDGVPVIGHSQKYNNLFYSMGHQLLGLQSAPGSARLAGDLILGRTPYTDPVPFRASRFESY